MNVEVSKTWLILNLPKIILAIEDAQVYEKEQCIQTIMKGYTVTKGFFYKKVKVTYSREEAIEVYNTHDKVCGIAALPRFYFEINAAKSAYQKWLKKVKDLQISVMQEESDHVTMTVGEHAALVSWLE